MALQQRKLAAVEDWAHSCDACSGRMKLVMATPGARQNGGRFYACEYVCDCGYREIFDEVL